MTRRKPVLLIDDGEESRTAVELLSAESVEYVEYHIRKFEESCCGELPTTRAPSIFAPEGLYKGLDGVREFIAAKKNSPPALETDSSYW
ncbi:MAG TPA: hypothetical protein VFA15_01815 [Nitrososphaera sp.]|nr:hypothetical protein [Nitrososphaera sp.]